MGIRLYYSHRTEDLAGKLASNLRSEQCRQDPFLKSTVIIPNKNLEQWLKMEIARRNSIATNIVFPFLEKGLWNTLSEIDPSSEKPTLLSEDTSQLVILAELLSIDAGDKELKPLADYLYGRGKEKPADYYRKAWQLSEKLGKCFREYEYNREKMIKAWLGGTLFYRDDPSPNLKAMEHCQRALYMRVFGPDGTSGKLRASNGTAYKTLPQYERAVFHGSKKPSPKKIDRPIHVFGLSQISEFHTRLLFELGRHSDIKLYQINVSSEFWEDVTTPQEDVYRKFKGLKVKVDQSGEYLESRADDNRLLKLWGKPGRENVKLLSDLEEACSGRVEFDTDWVLPRKKGLPGNDTCLEAVQDHILQRIGGDKRISQDRSIQIAGAPGIYREAETVYNSIVENMRRDNSLRLTDIAVLVPAMAKYKPVIEAVFSRDKHLVPFNMSDTTAADDSIYARALLDLLELVDSSFSRKNVFSLLLNECFLAASGVSREDALIWLKWADRLNIFHCLDMEDKKYHGYGENDLYTWHQGLLRLRLGRIMETDEDALTSGKFRSFFGVVPYSDMDSRDAKLVSAFSTAVEGLASRLLELRLKMLSCAKWAEKLSLLIDEFLAVPGDRPEESRVAFKVRSALETLSGLDDMFRGSPFGDAGFGLPSEYLKASLSKVATRHGKYLSGGVTISSLAPMRPIPFKVVYIMGLGEDEFPGREDHSILDLRHYARRIGDVSTPEANRYLFLETLMSVRGKLYLTYVSRDTQKDEIFYPCSVVNELRGYLSDYIVKGEFKTLKDEFERWPDDIPLKGSSPKYLADQKRVKEWSDILNNYSEPDRLACIIGIKDEGLIKLGAKELSSIRAKGESLIKWKNAASGASAGGKDILETGIERIRIRELADFLDNPIKASLRRNLEIYDAKEDDPLAAEDEPFYSAYPANRNFSVGVLEHFIVEWNRSGEVRKEPWLFVENYLKRYYDYCRLQGETPDEAFAGVDHSKFEDELKSRVLGEEGIAAFLEARKAKVFYRAAALGNSERATGADLRLEALRLELGPPNRARHAEVNGSLPFLWVDEETLEAETLVITMGQPPRKGTLARAVIQPVLFYLAMKAAGMGEKKIGSFRVHLSGAEKIVSAWRYDVSQADAGHYIESLADDLLDKEAFDLMPLAILFNRELDIGSMTERPSPEDMRKFRTKLEALVAAAEEDDYSAYRPGRLVGSIDANVPDDAYMKVLRRIVWLVRANLEKKGKKDD